MPVDKRKKKEKKKIEKSTSSNELTLPINAKDLKTEVAVQEDEKDEDEHPFSLGAIVLAEWGLEKSARLCQVIERSQTSADDEDDVGGWSYYVHFLDFNRRMDEWITPERVLAPPSAAAKQAKEYALAAAAAQAAKATYHGKTTQDGDDERADDEDGLTTTAATTAAAAVAVAAAAAAADGARRRRKRKSDDDLPFPAAAATLGATGVVATTGGVSAVGPTTTADKDPTVVADMEHDEHEGGLQTMFSLLSASLSSPP
jgi:hypothetical protein